MFLSKPIECATPRVNIKVKYGLWMIMMCRHRFILGKKRILLVNDTDNGGSCTCVKRGNMWEILYFPLNFVVNLKLL